MPKPLKPSATIDEHVARLRSRGMDVDSAMAEQWLTSVSYYRLSGYWHPARIPKSTKVSDTKRLDDFKPGTAFEDVTRLYEGLKPQDQREIAESFGIRPDFTQLSREKRRKLGRKSPLVRWMEQLTVIRNTYTHHARLWNGFYTPAGTAALRTQPEFSLLPEGQSERIFGTLVVMSKLLRFTSPGAAWPKRWKTSWSRNFYPTQSWKRPALGFQNHGNEKFRCRVYLHLVPGREGTHRFIDFTRGLP